MKKPILQAQGKHFYSHIVEFESLRIELDTLDLKDHEKAHLLSLAESNIHHGVLDAILSELSSEDKKVFLNHLADDKHDEIWKLLQAKVEQIEEKIRKTADEIKKELQEDIQQAKRNQKA